MEIFLSIAGTALFGLVFYLLTIRKNTLRHFKINSYEIGRGLMNEFPKLNLSYDNKVIENNFTVLKGGIINSGKDIKSNDIEFDMILPETCNIVDVNIKTSDDNLVVTTSKDKNKLHYKIEKQILHDDLFTYLIIVDSSENSKKLHDKVSFKHRMFKTKKISCFLIFDSIPDKKEFYGFSLTLSIMFTLEFILFLYCCRDELPTIPVFIIVFTLITLVFSLVFWSVFIYGIKNFKEIWRLIQYE